MQLTPTSELPVDFYVEIGSLFQFHEKLRYASELVVFSLVIPPFVDHSQEVTVSSCGGFLHGYWRKHDRQSESTANGGLCRNSSLRLPDHPSASVLAFAPCCRRIETDSK